MCFLSGRRRQQHRRWLRIVPTFKTRVKRRVFHRVASCKKCRALATSSPCAPCACAYMRARIHHGYTSCGHAQGGMCLQRNAVSRMHSTACINKTTSCLQRQQRKQRLRLCVGDIEAVKDYVFVLETLEAIKASKTTSLSERQQRRKSCQRLRLWCWR